MPEVFVARHQYAHWTGRAGDPAGAARLYLRIAEDYTPVLGPDHEWVLDARHNQAHWCAASGGRAGRPSCTRPWNATARGRWDRPIRRPGSPARACRPWGRRAPAAGPAPVTMARSSGGRRVRGR
ncbi:tetratricopeptide repeat protein [Streptacidiphilus sp. 4-A2]|nr:tetratricopeptide repeat protein [Streptacidiphilus sp. 4-A2]